MMIKGILFDFDGVLVQSEPLHMATFLELLAPYGVKVPPERWYREFAGTGSRHIFEVLVKEHSLPLSVDDLVAQRKSLYESKVRAGMLKETPGAKAFLEHIRGTELRVAIVSGSHRTNVQAALSVLGLGRFDLIVSGDDLKERKPDPAPFLHAAKTLGIKPSECLVFEDSVSGCEAARRAGMRLVFVRPEVKTDPGRYDFAIHDFRGLSGKKLDLMLA
jgi:HAD superfamily hydrolase (TIGR01509 family)